MFKTVFLPVIIITILVVLAVVPMILRESKRVSTCEKKGGIYRNGMCFKQDSIFDLGGGDIEKARKEGGE